MHFVYNFLIRVYVFGIWIYSAFNKKAKLWINGRRRLFDTLSEKIQKNEQYIWFHCASLGEFEQGRPLIEMIKKEKPEYKIILSFFSPSGYEQRKNYEFADIVTYLPSDTTNNARRFLNICNPSAAYFVKYEFWHNFLRELRNRKTPTYLVSGILRRDHYLFKWYSNSLKRNLNAFTKFFVQDDETKALLDANGYTNSTVSGDTRFDRVKNLNGDFAYPIGKFILNKTVLVAGSTWAEDENAILGAIDEKLKNELQIVIVPHEVNQEHIKSLVKKFSTFKPQLSSNLKSDTVLKSNCLIVDEVGLLSSLYAYATIAYVGGGFGAGIHNTLEPASYGIPVIFGPNYEKFREAKQLIDLGAGFSISNAMELKNSLTKIITDKNVKEDAGKKAKQYILNNIGATQAIYEQTVNELNK